ncbi:MAG: hypothetical protein D6751_00035 [Deltaproteobacteria bacterium]|nr:MAG: hypothetical protein D6751_00035 [Deltaproteobacteria bacterium]
MHCPCPKCNATFDLPLDQISDSGGFHPCPECGAKFWVGREAFTLRVYPKQGNVYCADCGAVLEEATVCVCCGALWPDYIRVQKDKPAARKARGGGGFSFEFGGSKPAYAPVIVAESAEKQPRDWRWLWWAACAALVIALVAGGVTLLKDLDFGGDHDRDFVVALYGLRSGIDQNVKVARNRADAWEKQSGSARAIAPPIPDHETARLSKSRAAIDLAMDKLKNAPDKYAAVKKRYDRLFEICQQAYRMNEARPDSPKNLREQANAIEKSFVETALPLKQEMPSGMRKELVQSVGRYRNLAFLK